MNHWLESMQHLQLSEALVAGGVDAVLQGWKAPSAFIGRLCTEAERWHAAFRDMHSSVSPAGIMRARTVTVLRAESKPRQ
jgi:hypothetical protein